MNIFKNQKWMVLIMTMIISSMCFVSCDDGNNENTTNEPATPSDSRAIDLGLSVYWAGMNVGASSQENIGLYFAWGETKGYRWTQV